MKPMIEVEDLYSTYGDRFVLQGVTMQVRAHEIMTIVGGSGCGKTTLLKHVIGLYTPHSGRIRLFGREMLGMDEAEFGALLKQVGVMFQYGALLNSLTVGENVALPLQMHTDLPDALIYKIVRLKLHLVELDQAFELYPPELSGGMRKRAALARAIVMDPKILFCDEPCAGLDPMLSLEIDRLLLKLNQALNMTIVLVTHELESIRRIAHRITMLDAGKVLFSGTLEEAERSGIRRMEEFFLRREA
ncbi:MAG: ATP-binding cassette domain-containing protein [Candidatus Latescibacteria bacterium]|nr:ATP-binding cassette domain-containing protein [Candidatus Latescibacterota bacterium]MCK5526537.1 ATP-binding cassette domain-containing protein [Candidatus Latescibacterota bacterium]